MNVVFNAIPAPYLRELDYTSMTVRLLLSRVFLQEDLNFILTNRIPRGLLTRFMGWFSKIEQPWVRDASIGAWKRIAELNLDEAEKSRFTSMHDCFTRKLKPGARPVDADPAILTSPCDAIVGAFGSAEGTELIQAKGFPYSLADLLHDPQLVEHYRDGCYVTLRITSSMYHRFHAPCALTVDQVTYISGDTWNVNPIALKRVERLFCKNERAVIRTRMDNGGHLLTLVPVAAVLVASIRLHCLNVLLHLDYQGANVLPCSAHYAKGEEMGWFQHGSTIIVFAPKGFAPCSSIRLGEVIRVGQALLRLP
jgi:phosphatidylserine decarboxylase